MMKCSLSTHSVGLGLRRELVQPLLKGPTREADFLEVAPENWMAVGPQLGKQFRELTERYPFTTHGLSLSLGSPAPLDVPFIKKNQRIFRRSSNWLLQRASKCLQR